MRDLLFKPGDIKSALAMVDAPQLLFVVPQFGFRKEPKHTYVHSTIVRAWRKNPNLKYYF